MPLHRLRNFIVTNVYCLSEKKMCTGVLSSSAASSLAYKLMREGEGKEPIAKKTEGKKDRAKSV